MMADVGTNFQISVYVAGAALISSFFTGLFSLKWLINWLKNGKFHYFGLYCITIGIITLFCRCSSGHNIHWIFNHTFFHWHLDL